MTIYNNILFDNKNVTYENLFSYILGLAYYCSNIQIENRNMGIYMNFDECVSHTYNGEYILYDIMNYIKYIKYYYKIKFFSNDLLIFYISYIFHNIKYFRLS